MNRTWRHHIEWSSIVCSLPSEVSRSKSLGVSISCSNYRLQESKNRTIVEMGNGGAIEKSRIPVVWLGNWERGCLSQATDAVVKHHGWSSPGRKGFTAYAHSSRGKRGRKENRARSFGCWCGVYKRLPKHTGHCCCPPSGRQFPIAEGTLHLRNKRCSWVRVGLNVSSLRASLVTAWLSKTKWSSLKTYMQVI